MGSSTRILSLLETKQLFYKLTSKDFKDFVPSWKIHQLPSVGQLAFPLTWWKPSRWKCFVIANDPLKRVTTFLVDKICRYSRYQKFWFNREHQPGFFNDPSVSRDIKLIIKFFEPNIIDLKFWTTFDWFGSRLWSHGSCCSSPPGCGSASSSCGPSCCCGASWFLTVSSVGAGYSSKTINYKPGSRCPPSGS